MRPDEARMHALKAALKLRTGTSTPAGVIDAAKQFETYIAADGDTASTPLRAAHGQAAQETASAGSRRK